MVNYLSSFDKEDFLKCVCGEFFGEGNVQFLVLFMLMMDCIIDIFGDGGLYGKGYVVVEFDIIFDLWFFDCYFFGNLIMLGCFGLDGLW